MSDISYVPGVLDQPPTPPKELKSPAELPTLKPGTAFSVPGQGTGYWAGPVKTPADWSSVPEGAFYTDPTSKLSQKPRTEPVGVGTQILYDMASNPRLKRQVLESVYDPKNIVETPDGGFLVKQGNKWLRPGAGILGPALGFAASEAAPTTGMVGGAAAAGLAGLESGPGAIATAIGGGTAGFAAGEAFNDMVLSMMGFNTSLPEYREQIEAAPLYAAGGELGGRALKAVVPAAKNLVTGLGKARSMEDVKNALPSSLRWLFGTDPEALMKARRLATGNLEQGLPPVTVAPSSIHHDIPMVRLIVEEFDPMFRQTPLDVSRDRYYEAAAQKLGKNLGIERTEPYLDPTHKVGLYDVGAQVKQSLSNDLAAAHDQLDRAIAGRQAAVASNIAGSQAQLDSQQSILAAATAHLQDVADRAVKEGFADVDKSISDALAAGKTGANAGELWRSVGDRLNKIDMGIEAVAARGYRASYTAAGQTPMALLPINMEARQLLDTLPQGFENQFPGAVRQLESLGKPVPTGLLDAEGKEILAPPNVTLEQAHKLRNILRAKVDWNDPQSSAIDFQAKKLAGIVNDWMHSPAQPPVVQAGVKLIDKADSIYRAQKGMFDQKAVHTIVQKMNEGFVDDAPALAKMVLNAQSTEARDNLRKLIGPKLWGAVQAADAKSVLESAVDSTGQMDPKKLATLVTQRLRDKVWQDSDVGTSVVQAANRLSLVRGAIPPSKMPGDSIANILQQAEASVAEAKRLAQASPIGLLDQEMKRLAAEKRVGHTAIDKTFREGPLGPVLNPTVGAIDAAEKIISNPDLFIAAADHFGRDSEAFTMLRQAYAEIILERGGIDKVLKLDPDVQQALFPGITQDTAVSLAKDMAFITGGRSTIGGSMAATARVTNPLSELSKIGGHPVATALSKVPILGPAVGRQLIGRFYALVSWGITHPKTLDFLARGLEGSEAEREASLHALQLVDRAVQSGSERGLMQQLGVAIAATEANRPQKTPPPKPPLPRRLIQPSDNVLRSIQP